MAATPAPSGPAVRAKVGGPTITAKSSRSAPAVGVASARDAARNRSASRLSVPRVHFTTPSRKLKKILLLGVPCLTGDVRRGRCPAWSLARQAGWGKRRLRPRIGIEQEPAPSAIKAMGGEDDPGSLMSAQLTQPSRHASPSAFPHRPRMHGRGQGVLPRGAALDGHRLLADELEEDATECPATTAVHQHQDALAGC